MTAGFSGSPASMMRVGHAERETVAAELREHYASGRLTLDELNERLDAALTAKTRADLDTLMTDLPPARQSAGTAHLTRGGKAWNAGSGRRAGQAVASMTWAAIVVSALLVVGFLGAFGGLGVGRPFGIVLVLAGLAFLRRLLFGRHHHRHHHTRGPRRPC